MRRGRGQPRRQRRKRQRHESHHARLNKSPTIDRVMAEWFNGLLPR